MLVEQHLDLDRPDLEAARVDHPLEPVGDEEVAFLVHPAEVAGPEELAAVEESMNALGRLGMLPVWPVKTIGPRVMISPTSPTGGSSSVTGSTTRESTPKIRMPRHCSLGALGRIGVARRGRLGEPVALGESRGRTPSAAARRRRTASPRRRR
jgi:hypothetical protein